MGDLADRFCDEVKQVLFIGSGRIDYHSGIPHFKSTAEQCRMLMLYCIVTSALGISFAAISTFPICLPLKLYVLVLLFVFTTAFSKVLVITNSCFSYSISPISIFTIELFPTFKVSVAENINSDFMKTRITENGVTSEVAATETLNVGNNSIVNIDIGLIEYEKHELVITKTLEKAVVKTNKRTRTYNFNGKQIGKVENSCKGNA